MTRSASSAQPLPPVMSHEEWLNLIKEAQAALEASGKHMQEPAMPVQSTTMQVGKAYLELWSKMAADPARMFSAQHQLWQDSWQLMQEGTQRFFQPAAEEVAPAKPGKKAGGDKRFKDAAWEQNAAFHFLKQSYLLLSNHLQSSVRNVEGLSPQTAQAVEFYTRQMLDAMSPSNQLYTNPEVLRATVESRGENLLNGYKNLLKDMQEGNIRMTDIDQFELGKTLATTPGSVVYQNELMQLIQYSPTTKDVHAVPMLMVPAWINKYYILDLSPENSLVSWMVNQGFTVFVVSWVNPDARYAETRFDDYMLHGILAAMDAVEKATGSKQVHLTGYCLGGTLLSITMAYLTAKKQAQRVASTTYLTTMVDFSEPGDLGVFVSENHIIELEARMKQRGYLDGREMATTFNLLRANDLIWSFVVNNYLMGKAPMPFDLLYWNSDATRLPAAMHSFYLRNMYLHNRLKDPGGIIVDKIAINLHAITTPSYVISAQEDHIAPWKSTYAATGIYKGETRFVLSGSGHIAGVINPPSKNKYKYHTNSNTPHNPDQWLEDSTEHAGSWWSDWAAWLKPKSGGKVPARKPGDGKLTVLEAAPGAYAKVRS